MICVHLNDLYIFMHVISYTLSTAGISRLIIRISHCEQMAMDVNGRLHRPLWAQDSLVPGTARQSGLLQILPDIGVLGPRCWRRPDWNQFATDWWHSHAFACLTPKNWIPVCKCNITNSHLARPKHGWWVPYRAWLLNWPRHDIRAASAKLTAASEISFSNSSALPLRNLSCICSSVQWSSMQPLKYNTAKSRICEASFYFCCCRTKQPQFRVVFLQL